nr:immunoglobulin heavy chain junction region [Mus musculus]MBK4196209.1 immunoglobulin heavy chain junction region [Mus musculus]
CARRGIYYGYDGAVTIAMDYW